MNPFTGPEWEGWEVRYPRHPSHHARKDNWIIDRKWKLFRGENILGRFPTPEVARQVVELIETAEAGKPIPSRKDVAELVEALANLAYGGVDDFGGSYVNLQVGRMDIAAAQILLEKTKEKYGL